MADDDIERLLREVDALNSTTPTPSNVPAKRGESAPVKADGKKSGARLPFAIGTGVVMGVGTWFIGWLPFVSAPSMGIGGAIAGFATAFILGPPRWFSKP